MFKEESQGKGIPFNLFYTLIAVYWGWFLYNILYAAEQLFILKQSSVDDAEFFYVWTGVFALICVFVFVPAIIYTFNLIFKGNFRFLFPIYAALTANVVLALFLFFMDTYGNVFETIRFLFTKTTFAGAVFGIIYLLLSSRKGWGLQGKSVKIILLSIILFSFHAVLAVTLPSILRFTEMNYSAEARRDKEKEAVLSKIKTGDKIDDINKQWKGLFSFSKGKSYANFWVRGKEYRFTYENGVITEVNGKKQP